MSLCVCSAGDGSAVFGQVIRRFDHVSVIVSK